MTTKSLVSQTMDIKNPTPEFGVSSTIMQGRRSGANATPSIALDI